MPTCASWERMSGGPGNRNLPLLKYIDKRMYEHSILTRQVVRSDTMEPEREACLIQLWNATRMYLKAFEGPSTFSRAKRSSARADGYRRVDLGAGGQHNRNDAVGALHGMVADELMGLLDARNEADLKVKIRASAVHDLDPKMRDTVDHKDGRLVARYLSRDERARHRVIFENGQALMHPRDPAQTALGWVPANTCDALHSMASFKNSCALEVSDLLKRGPGMGTFFGGAAEATAFWSRAYGARKCGIEGFVLTHGRKLYMSAEHRNGEFFHSAYTAGSGVVCSGSVIFADGLPTLVANLSGHYKPTPEKVDAVVRLFEMAGVPTRQLSLVIVTPLESHYFYSSVDAYRNALGGELA